jgi:hypothetical protein
MDNGLHLLQEDKIKSKKKKQEGIITSTRRESDQAKHRGFECTCELYLCACAPIRSRKSVWGTAI